MSGLTEAKERSRQRSDKGRVAVVKAFTQVGGPYWSEALSSSIPFDDIVCVYEYGNLIEYTREQHAAPVPGRE